MALWAVQAAQLQDVPPNVSAFLRRHEQDEQAHLRQFEAMLGRQSQGRTTLPSVPRSWPALAVQLFGYEALGLEFARLLIGVRPDLSSILDDELTHVGFFEREIGKILAGDPAAAGQAQMSARAWWRKIPKTVDRYVEDVSLLPVRAQLREGILCALQERFRAVGLQTTGT